MAAISVLPFVLWLPLAPHAASLPSPVEQGAVVRRELVQRLLADITAERLSGELDAALAGRRCAASDCRERGDPSPDGNNEPD